MTRHANPVKLQVLTAGLLLCALICLAVGADELPTLAAVVAIDTAAPPVVGPLPAVEISPATGAGLESPSAPRAPPLPA